ncbi:MAG: ribonuclease H-like domain-containing protein [Candidatus Paceibacterota bacterium]|nr:MAG: ribonuclease H-like domain-containing protein [Candidatus Paceibacterota bacterium]
MSKIVFDIETKNIFSDVGERNPAALDISVVGIYDYRSGEYKTFLEEEFNKLWPILSRANLLIGFNSDHFDIPLLNKYYPGDLTKIKSLDILKEIKESFGRRMKLDQIAEGTLGIRKSGFGLQATEWWKKGEVEKVKKYCLDDVKITKEIYEYALKNSELKFAEGGKIMEIKLDVKSWQESEQNGTTGALPF